MTQSITINDFRDCVVSIFSNWSALQLAVDHGMGGSPLEANKKVAEMANNIAAFCFSKNASDGGDIAAELEDLMDDSFDTILEDDSADEIGQLLFDLSRKWSAGEKDYVINYVQKLKKDVVKNHINSEPNSEVTEGMDVVEEESINTGVPNNQPDQDGWVVVTKSKGHRH